MRNFLSALHYANDSSLRLVVSISSDTLVGLLVLLLGFFGLDLVDFDAVFGVRKIEI